MDALLQLRDIAMNRRPGLHVALLGKRPRPRPCAAGAERRHEPPDRGHPLVVDIQKVEDRLNVDAVLMQTVGLLRNLGGLDDAKIHQLLREGFEANWLRPFLGHRSKCIVDCAIHLAASDAQVLQNTSRSKPFDPFHELKRGELLIAIIVDELEQIIYLKLRHAERHESFQEFSLGEQDLSGQAIIHLVRKCLIQSLPDAVVPLPDL
mmetsp:Transcript_37955/g.95340  ORF Transcript_37955/g.95340 Transcript_37955/m.95340 type:complete len:207 (+) Transcript_37955:602-1222(+)